MFCEIVLLARGRPGGLFKAQGRGQAGGWPHLGMVRPIPKWTIEGPLMGRGEKNLLPFNGGRRIAPGSDPVGRVFLFFLAGGNKRVGVAAERKGGGSSPRPDHKGEGRGPL